MRFVLKSGLFAEGQKDQFFFSVRQELFGEDFDDIVWLAKFNRTQRVNFAQSFRPVAVWTKIFVHVCGWIDKLNSNVLFFEIVFDESFDGESFTFKKVFSEGNASLALDIDWIDNKLLNGFDDAEKVGVFLKQLTFRVWGFFFQHFFDFFFDWLIN